ncbi:methyltransferase domain-containing protein [archaeon]|nr:MAG: methyltransferase domain-containing protein [archaeon]
MRIRDFSPAYKALVRRNLSFFDKAQRNWEVAWQENLTPWDLKGTVCPPLVEVIEKRLVPVKDKVALVPGCGSGYECIFLRKAGFCYVTGLDLSNTAVNLANDLLSKNPVDNLHFQAANFFTYTSLKKADFIFDYLFFSAIDPPLRPQWAKAIATNLSSDGILCTLVFPLKRDREDASVGPPYPVTLEDYKAVLTPHFEIVHINEVCVCIWGNMFMDL